LINNNSYKIIIVEDVELILKSIVRNIQQLEMGFEIVATAENGKTALDLIGQYTPDIVISDIKMPIMNGLELLDVVSKNYPYIVKIIISGYDEFEYAQQALKFEVKDYLLKPLREEELKNTLDRVKIYLDSQRERNKKLFFTQKDSHNYSPEQIVDLLIAFFKENYDQEISMDTIANNLNFNSSYLSKIFTKYTGENPSKHLTTVRINKAKYLLANDKNLSIKEVGELVGYPNQYYFSRIFKAITGKNPAKFKNDQT
jgi:YesN/AraC family two-component response regulator